MLTILWVQYILRVNQGILGTILKVDWRETETHQQCMPGTQTTSTCGVGPKTIFLQVIFLVQCAPSLSVCLILSLPHSLSCFPNGSDSSIHKVADDPSRLILGKTSAAQGGVRPCFYAEIPAKAPAAGPYTIATSTSTTV
jgi:hypothetical protein